MAEDVDQGQNGQVTYSIQSSGMSGLFKIDPVTGSITTSAIMDREIFTQTKWEQIWKLSKKQFCVHIYFTCTACTEKNKTFILKQANTYKRTKLDVAHHESYSLCWLVFK